MTYDDSTAFRAFLRSTSDQIFFLDLDGRYRFVGQTAAAALGFQPDQMTGRTPQECGLPAMLCARLEIRIREALESGRAIRDEAALDAADGQAIFEYEMSPVFSGGEPLGAVIVTRDVTGSRRASTSLRESEAKFSVAFNRSPLALTITSMDDGRLIDVNEGFVHLSGYSREEAIGRTPEELGLWVEPEVRAERFARMRAGEHVADIEARFRIRDGRELIGVIGSAVVEINLRRCVLSSVVDITERKLAEQAKDDFLTTLSHELRTPLTAGYGWVKLLETNSDPELLATGLRAIENSLVAQVKLIDDLLDVSRIAARTLSLEMKPVDLGAVVDATLDIVRPSARAKQITLSLEHDDGIEVLADAARLEQVLLNLLSNAIKFTPSGGSVELSARKDGQHARILVQDSGEGIDPEFLPFVFDRFRQADDSNSRKHGGLGIGLSIAASLVEAHGGKIKAESEGPGRGSTFSVTLPIVERQPPAP